MCRGVESGFLDAYLLSILKGQQGNGKFYVHTYHTTQLCVIDQQIRCIWKRIIYM